MDNQFNSKNLSKILNMAKEAVDISDFGPFYQSSAENLNVKNVSPVNWQLYITIVSSLLAKKPEQIDFTDTSSLL